MINDEFTNWAEGFSGCDGGNPFGRIWLCGIEFGGPGHTEETLIYDDVTNPPWVDPEKDEFIRYQYNWKAIKLLAALNGGECTDYKSFFKEQLCFAKNSNYFKLNLYPIGFRDTSHHRWEDWLHGTGFATKQRYLDWCEENRFPVLRGWLIEYSPRFVLCTGITRHEEFRSAFGDGTEEVIRGTAGGKDFNYFLTNDRKTLVAIIYFLGGRYGLRSDDQLTATGRQLGSVLHEELGHLWNRT